MPMTGRNAWAWPAGLKSTLLMCCYTFCFTLTFLSSVSSQAEAARPNFLRESDNRSTNLKPFPKWTGVMERYYRQQAAYDPDHCGRSDAMPCAARDWQRFLDGIRGKGLREQVLAVNSYFNKLPYIIDANNWGKNDYWVTPYEFLSRNGDCEDYAIAKYISLKEIGVSVDDMRVTIVQDMNLGGIVHAILEVEVDGEWLVLDNQAQQVLPASRIYHYKPIYAINESAWWAYR